MAEVDTGGKGGGKKGPKKVSTKIDMTPMVDLAFLLITFFMLTTTFSKPQTMEVNMPDKTQENKKMDLKESKTIVIMLAAENRIFYYQGIKDPEVREANFGSGKGGGQGVPGIRSVISDKIKTIGDPFFVIKAKNDSKYANLVDILDEMAITHAERYAIVDITPNDLELIEKSPKAPL